MKKHRWLTITVTLALAVVMLWAVPTLAQGRGKGHGARVARAGAAARARARPRAPAYNTCPNYPAYQSGQGPWCNNPQAGAGRRGPRGGGRNAQPNPQTTAPHNPITSNPTPSSHPPPPLFSLREGAVFLPPPGPILYPHHTCNFLSSDDNSRSWQDIAPPVSAKAMSQNVSAV